MKIPVLLLVLLVLLSSASHAQVARPPINVLSPNAASLGEYGEIPVSPFTGIPNISVPLYTIEDGSTSLPLSLSYYAAGCRPDVHPGWVGTGWSLQAGGVITRTVNDSPDDFDADPSIIPFANQNGFFWRYALLNPTAGDAWNSSTYLQNLAQNGLYHADTQPDEYSFTYPGGSGKFYLNQTGSWQVDADKPVVVSLLDGTNQFMTVPFNVAPGSIFNGSSQGFSKTFGGFRITAEDGTIYEFGNSNTAIDYSTNIFNQGDSGWIADAWYLTKIIYPNNHTVNLMYEGGPFINQMYITFFTNYNQTTSDQNWFQRIFTLEPGCNSSSSPAYGNYFGGKLIRPVYLRSIATENTKVWFDRSITTELMYPDDAYLYQKQIHNNKSDPWIYYLAPINSQIAVANAFTNLKLKWQKLYAIRVEQTGIALKTFKLTFSDTDAAINTPAYTAATQTRLTLLGVQEFAGDGTGISKPAYKFDYYNIAGLPPYLENQNDHWGFFDARYSDVSDPSNYFARREANSDPTVYLRGTLTKITYPTGGVTEFDYGQHAYSQEVGENRVLVNSSSANKPAGGLRIKKITSYSLNNPQNKLTKEYFYVRNYTAGADPTQLVSSGIIGGLPKYSFTNYCVPAYNSGVGSTLCQSVFSTQPVIAATLNSQGSYVGYSQVVEKLIDGSYTIHSFSNFDTSPAYLDQQADIALQASHTPYEPFSSLSAARGRELSTAYYTPTDIRVKRTDITYTKYASPDFIRAIRVNSFPLCSNTAVSCAEGSAYRIYTDSYLPTTITEQVYEVNGQNPVTTTKTLDYYPNRLVRQETTTDSKGQPIQTVHRYCFNYPYPTTYSASTNPTVTAIGAMTSRNMLALPLETVTYKNGQVVGSTFQTFQASGPGQTMIMPYRTYQFEPASPVSQYSGITYSTNPGDGLILNSNDSQVKLKLSADSYDDKGNILGLTKEGSQRSSYQWGYNKTLLTAKVENAAPNEIFASSFEEDNTAFNVPIPASTWDTYQLRFESTNSDGLPARNVAHTGRLAGAMYTYNMQDQAHAFGATLTVAPQARKFVLSGWVYTTGPSAQIWLFMNRAAAKRSDGTIDYYNGYNNGLMPIALASDKDATGKNVTGKWLYLEKEIDVPSDVTYLGVRLTNYYNGATPNYGNNYTPSGSQIPLGVWFDDVRIHPADAQMTTYTHQPGVGVTSISDTNNKPVVTEYDPLTRLSLVRDQDGNIIKQIQYHYQH